LSLASIDLSLHDFDAAYRLLTAAKPNNRDEMSLYKRLVILGWACLGIGSRREARAAFAEALDLVAADMTVQYDFTQLLSGIAVAADPAAGARAARVKGAAAALRRHLEFPPNQWDQALEPLFVQPLIDTLGEEVWALEQAAGAAVTLDETIALARSLADGED
jgi:hypothetical protein